jgi:hypothetical protein
MPEIPIVRPAGISSDLGHHGFVIRIREEDMMVRPIRNDSLRNVRRGLGHKNLGSHRKHENDDDRFHGARKSQRPTHIL